MKQPKQRPLKKQSKSPEDKAREELELKNLLKKINEINNMIEKFKKNNQLE